MRLATPSHDARVKTQIVMWERGSHPYRVGILYINALNFCFQEPAFPEKDGQ